jgi:hypothetical protein
MANILLTKQNISSIMDVVYEEASSDTMRVLIWNK